jgi:hypothetical protein
MLKKSYGKMKMKKGSVLYHTSENKFVVDLKKPFLFLTYHPSEWDIMNKYVTMIRIKKDITLLFMIEGFQKGRIFSCLNTFTKHPNLNLAKKYDKNLMCYREELRKEQYDGWFTSIENKTSVEVGLINDFKNYKVLKTERLKRNWGYKKNKKSWGTIYPICTIERPVKLKLNLRYKSMIEEYKKYGMKTGNEKNTVFLIILENAKIYYHKADLEEIEWKC